MARQNKASADAVYTQITEWLGLSSIAMEFAQTHPRETRLVMAVAVEAAAAQFDLTASGDDAIPARLRPYVVYREPGFETVGVKDAALRLKVSRPTVYEWIERGILLAWKSTKRGWIIPAEQILGPGKVVTGIAQVREAVGDPELTWIFLSEPWPFEHDVARPIDKLKASEVEEVIGAVSGFGTVVT